MPSFKIGRVVEIIAERDGLQRVATTEGRAYVLTALTGPVSVDDDVVLNTTAVELGLGTGGWHVVHWNLANSAGWSSPGGGHVLKLRYTSLQADTGVAEERDGYQTPADLGGVPVVAIALHSQLAPVAAACKDARPDARLVYVMTDAASLPIALSDLVHDLRRCGLVDATVTCGQAFGGDHEAVNVVSGLDVAVSVAGADVVVAGTGPGVVGTGTTHGCSPLEVAAIVDAAAASGSRPVVALRAGDGDPRSRHRGISHHSATALRRAARPAVVPVPTGGERPPWTGGAAHDVIELDVPDAAGLLATRGLWVTTMGRGAEEEPRFFAYAAAAGVAAAAMLASRS